MASNNRWHPLIYNIDHTEARSGYEQQLQQQQPPQQQQQQPPQQQPRQPPQQQQPQSPRQQQQQQEPPQQQQQQQQPPPQQQQQRHLQNQGPSEFNIPYQSHRSRPYGSSDYAALLLQADPRFSNFTTSQIPASLRQDHRLSTGINSQSASTNFQYERLGLENNGHMISVPQPRKPIAKKIDMRPVEFYFQDKHLFNSPFPDVEPKSSVNQTLPTSFPLDSISSNGSHPFSTLHTPQAPLYSMNPAVMAESIPNFMVNSESLLPHMTNVIPFSNNSFPYSLNALAHGAHRAPVPSATGLSYQNIAPNLHSSAYQTFNPSGHINIHPAFPQARELQKAIRMHGKGEPAACELNPVQRDSTGRSVKTGRTRKAPASKKSDRVGRRLDRERQSTAQSSELHSSIQPRESQNGHSQRMNLQSLYQSVCSCPQQTCQHNFTAEQATMPQVANTVGTNEEPRCVSKSVQKEPVDLSYAKSNPMINQQLERDRRADESCSSTKQASAKILDSKQPETDTTNKETATQRACPNQRAIPQSNEDYNDILLQLKKIAEIPLSNINLTNHSISSSHNNENKMLLHKTNSLNGDRKNDLPHSLAYFSVLAKNNELSHSVTSSLAFARNNESPQSQAPSESDLPHSFRSSLAFSGENASSNELPHSLLPYSTFTRGNELPRSLASSSEFVRENELLQSLAYSAASTGETQSRNFLASSAGLARENELPHFLASSSTITRENELPDSHASSSTFTTPTRGNDLPHSLATSSTFNRGNELPHFLAASSTLTRGIELPHSLTCSSALGTENESPYSHASSSVLARENELPHSPASSSVLARENEVPHSPASSSVLARENELPHSLASSSALTRENELPHSLAPGSAMTKESESPRSLASPLTLTRGNELPHSLTYASKFTKRNEFPYSLAPFSTIARGNELAHSLASSSALARENESPHSFASFSTWTRENESLNSLASVSALTRENKSLHSLASSSALTRENESPHSLASASALTRENESPHSLASLSVFEAPVQLHRSDREKPVSETSAGTNKDPVNEINDPVNIVLCTDQDSKPTKNISSTKLSSNSSNQSPSKIKAQSTQDKIEVLGEQYRPSESLPLIHSHNENTKAQLTPILKSKEHKLPFKKRLEKLMPTERAAAFALVGLAENDFSSSNKHSDKDQPHVHQTAGPSRTESTSKNVCKESLSREKDLPRPDVRRSPEKKNKTSEHFTKSSSSSVEIVHHEENLKEDGNSFMTSLQLSTELGKVNRKWDTMKKYGRDRGVNHHSEHTILKMLNEMKPPQQLPTGEVITNQHKEKNAHTEAKYSAAVRSNTSWPAATPESTPDSIRGNNSTYGTVTDVTAPCSSHLTRISNMNETSMGACRESISSGSYSQYMSCKPYESELSMYNSGVGASNRQHQVSISCESILQNDQAECLEGIDNLQTTRLKGGKNLSAQRCNEKTGSTFKRRKIEGETIKSRKTASDHSAVNATGVDEKVNQTSDSPNLTMVGVETTSRIPLVNDSPLCSDNKIKRADRGYERSTHGFDLLVTAIEKKEQSNSIHDSVRQDLFGFNHKAPTLKTGPNDISETDTDTLGCRRIIEENQLQNCIKNENLKRIDPKTNTKAYEEEKKSATKTDDALNNQNILTAMGIENTSDSDKIQERFLKQGQNNLPLSSDNTFDPKYHFLDKDTSVVMNISSNNHDQYPESKRSKTEPLARSKEEISTLPLTVPAARENTSKVKPLSSSKEEGSTLPHTLTAARENTSKVEPLARFEEEKSTLSHTLPTESKSKSEDRKSLDNKTDTLSDFDDLKQDPLKSNPDSVYYSDISLNRLITPKLIDRYHSDFLKTFFLKNDNDEKDSMSSPEEITVYATNPRNLKQAACSKTLYKDSLEGKDTERNVKSLSSAYPSPGGNASTSTELCQNGKTTQRQYLISSQNSACGSETSMPTHESHKKPVDTSNTILPDINHCGGTRLDETISTSSTSSTSCSTSLETERRADSNSVSCSVTLSSPESKADYCTINVTDVQIQDVKKRHMANDNEVNNEKDHLPKRNSTCYLRDSKHKSKSECSNTPTFPLTKNLINIPDILAGAPVSVTQHDNQDSEDLENRPHGKSTDTCLKGEPTATSSTKKQRNREDSLEPPTLRPVVTGDDVFSFSLGLEVKTTISRRTSHSSPDLLPTLYVFPHNSLAEHPQHKAPRRINADVICEALEKFTLVDDFDEEDMSDSESESQREELRKNGSQIAIEEESQPVETRTEVEFDSDNTCGSNSKAFRNDGHETNSGDRMRNLAQSAIEETCSVTEYNSSYFVKENGNIDFSTSECECKAQTQKQKIIARDDEQAVTKQPIKSARARSSYSPKTKPKSSFLPRLQQNPSSKSTNASRVFRKYTLNETKNQLPSNYFGNEARKYFKNPAPFDGRVSFPSKETNRYDCGNAALKKQTALDANAQLLRNNGNSNTSGYMRHDHSTSGHFNLNHPLHSSHSKLVSPGKTFIPPAKQGVREHNGLPNKMSPSRSHTLSGAGTRLPLSALSTDNSTMFQFYGDVCSEESEDDAPRRLVIKESCSEQDSESDSERHGDAALKFPNLATFLPGQNLPWQSL